MILLMSYIWLCHISEILVEFHCRNGMEKLKKKAIPSSNLWCRWSERSRSDVRIHHKNHADEKRERNIWIEDTESYPPWNSPCPPKTQQNTPHSPRFLSYSSINKLQLESHTQPERAISSFCYDAQLCLPLHHCLHYPILLHHHQILFHCISFIPARSNTLKPFW